MRKKGKRDKMMSIDKPNENTLIYIHHHPPPHHPRTHKHISIQIHICTYTHYLLFKSDTAF